MIKPAPIQFVFSLQQLLQSFAAALLMVALLGCKGSQDGASTAKNPPVPAAKPAAAPVPARDAQALTASSLGKAVFSSEPEAGKDPFFPNSPRRKAKVVETSKEKETRVVAAVPPTNFLKLNGLWPSKTRPLALINKTSFSAGERGEITYVTQGQNKSEVQKVKLRVLEIREQSVLISVEGETGTRELRLSSTP